MAEGSIEVKEMHIDLNPQIKENMIRIGQQCAEEISRNSPVRTGVYASGWRSKFDDENENVVVYNTSQKVIDHSSLTHLLELGHRTRGGTTVPPQEHIRPAYNKYKKMYLDSLMQIKVKVGGNYAGK